MGKGLVNRGCLKGRNILHYERFIVSKPALERNTNDRE